MSLPLPHHNGSSEALKCPRSTHCRPSAELWWQSCYAVPVLIERRDLIDRFANYFVSDTAQNWYFQPREDWPPLPVSESEMLRGVERYRRRSMIAMATQWITIFAAFLWFCWEGYSSGGHTIGIDNIAAFPLAILIGVVGHGWAMRSSFRPFYRRLLEYAEDRQHSGGPFGSPNIILHQRASQHPRRSRDGAWWRRD